MVRAQAPARSRPQLMARPALSYGANPTAWWASSGRTPRSELDGLDLEELLEPELPQLPAVAGLLVAAEGCQRVERRPVDLDLAGADAPRHPLGVPSVL